MQVKGEWRTCITHIRRTHNLANHTMASCGRIDGRTVVWLGSALLWLSNNVIRIVTFLLSNTSSIPAKKKWWMHLFGNLCCNWLCVFFFEGAMCVFLEGFVGPRPTDMHACSLIVPKYVGNLASYCWICTVLPSFTITRWFRYFNMNYIRTKWVNNDTKMCLYVWVLCTFGEPF